MMSMVKAKWRDLVANTFVVALWSSAALLGYWTFLDNSPAFVSRIYQMDSEVHRGNVIALYSDIDWLRECSISSDRFLIHTSSKRDYLVGHQDTLITRDMVGKSQQAYSVMIFVPMNLPAGDYWIERRTDIVCNPMQRLFPIKFVSQRAPIKVLD